MQTLIHRSDSRGRSDHGWLNSRHSFSFADYYDPERMGFGKLRVLNDDVVAPGAGFGSHAHDNMEIVSIPLSGSLRHSDSMGNVHVIHAGEVQIMSAGTGLTHSEYNASATEPVNFLQVWVVPEKRDLEPRYDQTVLDCDALKNRFGLLVSPDASDASVKINQVAWFSMASIDAGVSAEHHVRHSGNGVYCFVIDGAVDIAGETLLGRDAAGFGGGGQSLEVAAIEASRVLCIEVPMR